VDEHVCNWNAAWPIGHPLPPELPERLQGPEVGALCIYRDSRDGPIVVTVLERSYVWSPGECRHKGGYRRYDWKVIERRPGSRVVVDDKDLTPLEPGMRIGVPA